MHLTENARNAIRIKTFCLFFLHEQLRNLTCEVSKPPRIITKLWKKFNLL